MKYIKFCVVYLKFLFDLSYKGAIEIIRDTLGQFVFVISLVKVDKKSHMGGGGTGVNKVRKKCHVLFEWPLIATLTIN